MSDQVDNREIILQELQTYSNGYMKPAGDWLMVCCPFHDDSTPSCGVYMSHTDPERLGNFHCFGCSESGSWNAFAERAGLQTIKEWLNKIAVSFDLANKKLEDHLLGDTFLTLKNVFKAFRVPEAQPWPEPMAWRGFSGKAVNRAGGYIAYDNYNDSIQVIFVVTLHKKVYGAVKAVYEKKNKKLAYITMDGEWVKKYGLLFYDQALSIIKKRQYKFIVLVEGPRDALRLLINGIPAVAVLGSYTFTKTKAMFVLSTGVSRIYVMPDNDSGGKTLWKSCKKEFRSFMEVVRVDLPDDCLDEKGKPIKVDPGNMPVEILGEFMALLKKKEKFVLPKVIK
jgi:5S rRNA maturation endonuclease (ribonuclease M5)